MSRPWITMSVGRIPNRAFRPLRSFKFSCLTAPPPAEPSDQQLDVMPSASGSRIASTMFIAGEPMNEATKRLTGSRNTAMGGPTCCSSPARITAMTSDSTIASSWSWVTKMQVMPSSRCSRLIFRGPEPGIEVGERLVHQEHRWIAHHGASNRDALALAAQSLQAGAPAAWSARGTLPRLRPDARSPRAACAAAAQAHVLAYRHVWIERIVLENHRNVALMRLSSVMSRSPNTICPVVSAQGQRCSSALYSCRSRTGRAA